MSAYNSGAEFAESMRAERDQHLSLGRIGGYGSTVASFCSCGLAFWGESVPEADNRRSAHQHDALGTTPGSWAVPPPETGRQSPSRRIFARLRRRT